MLNYLWIYGFNAIFKNCSVILYEPNICEDDRHRKTIEHGKENLVHINHI